LGDGGYTGDEIRRRFPEWPVEELSPFHPVERLLAEPDADTGLSLGEGPAPILMVGRLARTKNVPLALTAFAEYRQRFDPAARLVLAGSAVSEEALSEIETPHCGVEPNRGG